MQIQIFTIPILGGERNTEDMNIFLRSKKVLHMESQLVNQAQGAFWCFCIKYLEHEVERGFSAGRKKIDYREVLDEVSFKRFSQMREIRKSLSKAEAIPAYAVFTDEELAELARIEDALTLDKMKNIKGIGEKKLEKYGHHFINPSKPDEKS